MEDNNSYEGYIKSFNEGYIIQKHMPDLGDKLAKAFPEDSFRAEGFKDGREQYQIEQEKNRPKYLQKDRLDAFKETRDQIKDKEKDGPDKE